MTDSYPRRSPASSRTPSRNTRWGGALERFRSVVGIPLHLALLALLVTVLLGLQLASALDTGTVSRVRTGSTSIDGPAGPGKNAAGTPVVTESTLGPEVQRLIDSGTILQMASFDAARCLREQGIPDSVLIMEQVAWGTEETPSWLLVHGPMDRNTLRSAGGTVSATVVLPQCGVSEQGEATDNLLWTGQVMVGSV